MVFTVLCLGQLFYSFAVRSEETPVFSLGFLSNKNLRSTIAVSFLLQVAIIYVPFLNTIFKTQALSLKEFIFLHTTFARYLFYR